MAGKELRKVYGELFGELWSPIGSSHTERAGLIGITTGSEADRRNGRKLPEASARALLCIAVANLRRLKSDKSRRDFIQRGLDLRDQLEKENT